MATLDIVSDTEAREAIHLPSGHTDLVARVVSAVCLRVDELCGPVVARSVTENHDGGEPYIRLKNTPVSSITSVTEYDNTTAKTLTAETNSTKPSDGYLLDRASTASRYVEIIRRSNNADATFPTGRRNVVVAFSAGRYADTASVDAKFKVAVSSILSAIWDREAASWARGAVDPLEQDFPSSGFFNAVDRRINELLFDELSFA